MGLFCMGGRVELSACFFLHLECVTRKYPRAPEAAFANARDSANQYGLDQKVRHGVEEAKRLVQLQELTNGTDDE